MNIWAINKDISIKLLLLTLEEKFDLKNIELLITDDVEDKSIRISDNGMMGLSAYIYSFAQQQGNYGVHLEYPAKADSQPFDMEIFEELSLERVIDVLSIHFNLRHL